jgi:hypothetical protein
MAPADEIMPDFRAHKLHSGRSGKIVTNPKQAKAILLSYIRKEHGGKLPKHKKHHKKKHHKKVESKRS